MNFCVWISKDIRRDQQVQENRPTVVRWLNMVKLSNERLMSWISIQLQNISIIQFLQVDFDENKQTNFDRITSDIRDLIEIDDAMDDQALRFGPNGGLIFCMEYDRIVFCLKVTILIFA